MAESVATEALEADDDDYRGNYHVYVPYRAGLPRLKPYLRELWRRREFLDEMARSTVRADNMDTILGRLWNIIGPLLSALTYYLLVLILTRGAGVENYLMYLLCGVFLFTVLQSAMSGGARSVVSAGRMITNTSFPRVMLPLATVRTSLSKLWPMLIVLVIFGLASGIRPHWALISLVPIFFFYVLLCCGVAMFMATSQVFFRDTKGFIPFFSRIWMYASPVLWTTAQVPPEMKAVEFLNPMYAIVGSWSNAIVAGQWPAPSAYLVAGGWSIVIFFIGAYVFLSRERDFAVRI